MSEKYVFMLPALLEEGLCEDDSDNYSFLTFARPEISAAAKIIVELIGKDESNANTGSKKRVKVLMEFFAVALSLTIADTSLMAVATNFYKKWLADSSFFGDIKRQNKYICRMIKQLSLPFAFKEAKSSSTFSSQFLPLIMDILNILQELHINRGNELEHETWITLLNTSLGITDAIMKFKKPFQNMCHAEHAQDCRKKAVGLVFSVILTSGIQSADVWARVAKYCRMWSDDLDFLMVWGMRVNEMWLYLNQITYNLPFEVIPVQGGIFSQSHPFPNDFAKADFHNILVCIDHKKTADSPSLLACLANTAASAKSTAVTIAEQCSTGLEAAKYSAYAFLKFFGKFLTFTPILSETFDEAISKNVATLIDVIAKFELNGTVNIPSRFVAYIAQRTTAGHMDVISAFLNSGVTLYKAAGPTIPFISSLALNLIQIYRPIAKQEDTFVDNIVALYCSASGSSVRTEEDISKTFDAIFRLVTGMNLRLRLLISAISNGIDVYPMIANYLSADKFKSITTNHDFTCGLIILVGVIVRTNPTTISRVIELDIIPTILSDVQINEIKTKKGYDHIVIAALQMICEIIQWAPSAFHLSQISSASFEFLAFLTAELKTETGWFEKRKRAIQKLMLNVTNSLNIHIPALEFIDHKLCTASRFDEQAVTKLLNIKDPVINYFTVGNNLLISFIETKDGSDPLAFFARGQFGKAVFQVSDDYTNGKETFLSDEVQKSDLPACQKVEHLNLEMKGKEPENAPFMSMQLLDSVDSSLRDKYGKEFSTWLNWDKEAYYIPFGYKAPYQRLRVVDFLTTFGILDVENKLVVRPQNDIQKVKEVISKFDDFEAAPIVTVPIRHFLANDSNLELTPEKSKRMTPLMLDFLRQIGEAMESSPEAIKLHKLPVTNSSIPAFPLLSAFALFLTPAMGQTQKDAELIEQMNDKAPVRIVFNESGFELNIPKDEKPDSFVLVVSPVIPSLYNVVVVQTPSDAPSPFSNQQVLTAKSLALHISIALEAMLPTLHKTLTPPVCKKRGDLIKELCTSEKVPELAALSTGMFLNH